MLDQGPIAYGSVWWLHGRRAVAELVDVSNCDSERPSDAGAVGRGMSPFSSTKTMCVGVLPMFSPACVCACSHPTSEGPQADVANLIADWEPAVESAEGDHHAVGMDVWTSFCAGLVTVLENEHTLVL